MMVPVVLEKRSADLRSSVERKSKRVVVTCAALL